MKGRQQVDPSNSDDLVRAVLGHELGNLLHGLLGMAEMALAAEADPTRARWLQAIRTSGHQLGRLLDGQVLSSGRCAEPRDIDGIEWLEQAALSHVPAATAHGCRLLLHVDPDLPRTWHTDPCLLRLVFDNLLGNAVKYSRGGDVLVEAGRLRRQGSGSDALKLVVSDAGPGLPPGLGEELFRPYVRGRGDVEGSGLGLFVCRDAVTALGGRVNCRPAPCGASFRVELPGVLHGMRTFPRASSGLLRGLHCRLLLQGALRRSVAAVLDRWGLAWSDAGAAAPADATVSILDLAEAQPAPGAPGPDLVLAAAGQSGWVRQLPGPLLECTLVPALLEAAYGLSGRGEPGSPSGSSRSAPPGDRG